MKRLQLKWQCSYYIDSLVHALHKAEYFDRNNRHYATEFFDEKEILSVRWYFKDKLLHRRYGPAIIHFNKQGKIISWAYYRNGKLR